MLQISQYCDKKNILDKLLMIFLLSAVVLPAYIFKPYHYFDAFYWKAAALYFCVSVLLLLGAFKILISEKKIRAEQIYSVMPVIVYMAAVVVSTFLSPYSGEAVWGEWLFHEGALTMLCYGVIFIASRFIINNAARLNTVMYSVWITAVIIIIDSIFKYDAALRSTFYIMLVYSLLFIGFRYFTPKEGRYGKISRYIWITALVLFIDAGLKAVISGDIQCSVNDGGSFTHRNYLSSYFTLIFLPAAAGYFYSKENKAKVLFFLLSCVFFTILILNHTRSAWVGNTIGFGLLILLGRKKITLKKLAVMLISFTVIVFAVNIFSQGLVFTRFNTMVNDAAVLADKDSDKTYVGTTRFKVWELSIPLVPKYFWFGAGPDMFGKVFPQDKYKESVSEQYRGNTANAHNEYLNMLLNIGIFGLLAYLWLVVSIFKKYIGFHKRYGVDDKNLYLIMGLFCAWCAYLVQAFFNNSVIPTSPALWAVMGILSAVTYGKEDLTRD